MPVPWGVGTNYHTMSDTTGPGGRLAPELVDTGGKQRTISCSTEESGVESLSPTESSIPSSECSSPPTTASHSDPESETSDYPRNTPSPASSTKYRSRSGKTLDAIITHAMPTRCSRHANSNASDNRSANSNSSLFEASAFARVSRL